MRRFLPLFFLLLVASALMTYQASKGPINPLRPLNRVFFTAADVLGRAYGSAAGFAGEITAKKKHIKALENELASLRYQAGKERELALENRRLRELLALREQAPQHVATADVITRGVKRWGNTFTIDAGRARGVEKDMTVIAPGGLVGKVMRAEAGHSIVLLINDVRFAAAARLQETRQEVLVAGTGARACTLKYVSFDVKVDRGDVLISSGLDGLFPEGLKIGRVSRVSGKEGFFRDVEVVPSVDTSRLDEVTVIRR